MNTYVLFMISIFSIYFEAEKIEDEVWAKAKQLTAGWGYIANYTAVDVPLSMAAMASFRNRLT